MNAFDYLFLGALIVEIFTAIAGWDWIVMSIHNAAHAAGGGPDVQVFMAGIAPWFIALDLLCGFLLWFFIAVLRFGFFRFVLALFVGIEIYSLIGESLYPETNFWFLLSWVISVSLKVAAVVFSFQGDAGAWLRHEV
ncbi:MAG: hypothetical protein AAFY47_05640 [Pseudomonadota bacterium]